MKLKEQYDKILHVTVTFTLMLFATIWLSIPIAVGIVFALQVIKTIRNGVLDKTYKLYGDWLANLGGYALYALYYLLQGG